MVMCNSVYLCVHVYMYVYYVCGMSNYLCMYEYISIIGGNYTDGKIICEEKWTFVNIRYSVICHCMSSL